MSDTGIYEGRVRIFNGMHQEGEELRRVRISSSGSTWRLSAWDDEQAMFTEVDFLDDAAILPSKGKTVVFSGRSRQLRDEVGVDDSEPTRWELAPRGCVGCR